MLELCCPGQWPLKLFCISKCYEITDLYIARKTLRSHQSPAPLIFTDEERETQRRVCPRSQNTAEPGCKLRLSDSKDPTFSSAHLLILFHAIFFLGEWKLHS